MKYVGISMLILVVVGFLAMSFRSTVNDIGWKKATFRYLIAFGIIGWIRLAIYFLTKGV